MQFTRNDHANAVNVCNFYTQCLCVKYALPQLELITTACNKNNTLSYHFGISLLVFVVFVSEHSCSRVILQWNPDFTIVDLMINLLCPSKSNSKLYEAQSRFNNIRLNDIPGITMEM